MSSATRPAATWLVSFGDLLTILVCFFISSVAQRPWEQGPASTHRSGTPLAVTSVEHPIHDGKPTVVYQRWLSAVEIGEDGRMEAKLLNELEKSPDVPRAKRVVIRWCASLAAGSASRITGLRRQMLDVLPHAPVELHSGAVWCQGAAAGQVARIELVG